MRLLNFACAAAVASAAVFATTEASAQRRGQATTVVVINYQRVLAESTLGRDLAQKLTDLRNQFGTEAQSLNPEQQSLEQERQRLAQATRNMSSEQIRNNSTLQPQFEQFAQRLQQFEQRAQTLQGDLQCSQVMALRDFDRLVSPIVRSTMEARGAGVALDATQVQQVLPAYDITDAVMQELNRSHTVATVSRHPVSACQTQQ